MLNALSGQDLRQIHDAHVAGNLTITVDAQLPEGLAHDLDATSTFQLASLEYLAAETLLFKARDCVRCGDISSAPEERLHVTVAVRGAEGSLVAAPSDGDLTVTDLLDLLLRLRFAVEKAPA